MGKWGITGGPNVYSGNFPMYPTWTGGMGLTGEDGSQGYTERDNLQYKWGWPTDFLETGRTAAEQSEKYPLGEFSGMDFPPRPLPYDADEFAGTPIQRYEPAEGTAYTPMENIEYDALHLMNPADAGEFVDVEETITEPADDPSLWDSIKMGLHDTGKMWYDHGMDWDKKIMDLVGWSPNEYYYGQPGMNELIDLQKETNELIDRMDASRDQEKYNRYLQSSEAAMGMPYEQWLIEVID